MSHEGRFCLTHFLRHRDTRDGSLTVVRCVILRLHAYLKE